MELNAETPRFEKQSIISIGNHGVEARIRYFALLTSGFLFVHKKLKLEMS